jgi:hypothetical protein
LFILFKKFVSFFQFFLSLFLFYFATLYLFLILLVFYSTPLPIYKAHFGLVQFLHPVLLFFFCFLMFFCILLYLIVVVSVVIFQFFTLTVEFFFIVGHKATCPKSVWFEIVCMRYSTPMAYHLFWAEYASVLAQIVNLIYHFWFFRAWGCSASCSFPFFSS